MSPTFTVTAAALPKADAEKLAELLEGIVDLETSVVVIHESDEARNLWQVTLYTPDHPEIDKLSRSLISAGAPPSALEQAELPNRNWVADSLSRLSRVVAGRFTVHGSHDRPTSRGGIAVEIDAGTAFGTGHHGTTESCLRILDEIVKQRNPARVLDLGSGTGILAIAAAKAAPCRVVASDIDPEAVRVTAANARLNHVPGSITAVCAAGTDNSVIQRAAPYDLVFANILARPLVALSGPITRLTAKGGDIVLSGLLSEQERQVEAAFRNRNAVLHRRVRRGDWSALWLKQR